MERALRHSHLDDPGGLRRSYGAAVLGRSRPLSRCRSGDALRFAGVDVRDTGRLFPRSRTPAVPILLFVGPGGWCN